jgi:hypothetical protein
LRETGCRIDLFLRLVLHFVVDILVCLSQRRLLSAGYDPEVPSQGPVSTAHSLTPRSAYDFLKISRITKLLTSIQPNV